MPFVSPSPSLSLRFLLLLLLPQLLKSYLKRRARLPGCVGRLLAVTFIRLRGLTVVLATRCSSCCSLKVFCLG